MCGLLQQLRHHPVWRLLSGAAARDHAQAMADYDERMANVERLAADLGAKVDELYIGPIPKKA